MDDLDRFLAEDLGERGDVTTRALVPEGAHLRAALRAREAGVAAGLTEAALVFERFGVGVDRRVQDGDAFAADATLLVVDGPARGVLVAERLALNLVGRMSGIATTTRRLQDVVARANPRCRVAATRKTTPGFRAYEKKAVALGGGDPHRAGLHDAFLVKDNHLALVGPADAVRRCRALAPDLPVEVEADTLADAVAAAEAGADMVLLDNMSPADAAAAAAAVRAAAPACRIEVSGGLIETTLAAYAPFADRLSLGALTHSAASLDVGLDVLEGGEGDTR